MLDQNVLKSGYLCLTSLSLLNLKLFQSRITLSHKLHKWLWHSCLTFHAILKSFRPELTPWRARRQPGRRSKIQVGIIRDEKELLHFVRNIKRKLTVLALNWHQRIRNLVTKVTFSIVCWRHRTPNLVISRRCFTKVGKQMKMHVRVCSACWSHSSVH